MSRRCQITGKGVMAGNNVSHAHNKSRRRFLPNVQKTSVMSETLGRMVRLKVSAAGIRTLEKVGGLDAFLLATPAARLDPQVRKLKRQIQKKVAAAG
ncbi:MAG: 50S ribosomal protein L28 [Alphaproteobacteria bacterium]|nr:50S ribosomal protein L28 [Alphaproteobacteria bacterium]MCZ6741377.1 50S ribosomal protein L28 [Alphaproteobacteria bacterium]MCZ6814756.1 50S ribosomal protein L28 [Alphaproteobacteria bacterium]MCZ6849115.1 50S ribosomal protein L28 [Alphaproteobacteria bacterium]